MPPPDAPRLHLIDGSGYVYRAFHALPALNTSRGLPTNAILGFARVVSKLLREESPDRVAVVFDAPGRTFRDALYAGYKESRGPMPDELRAQIPYIRRLVAALRLPVIEEPGVEADDVIGTLATQATAAGIQTVVVTGDKDMMQLVDERTTPHRGGRGGGALRRPAGARARRAGPHGRRDRRHPRRARHRGEDGHGAGAAHRSRGVHPRASRPGRGERAARCAEDPRDARPRGGDRAALEDARHHPTRRPDPARPGCAALGGTRPRSAPYVARRARDAVAAPGRTPPRWRPRSRRSGRRPACP